MVLPVVGWLFRVYKKSSRRPATGTKLKAGKGRRYFTARPLAEQLESRTLLNGTFQFNAGTGVAVIRAEGSTPADTLLISHSAAGNLQVSFDGVAVSETTHQVVPVSAVRQLQVFSDGATMEMVDLAVRATFDGDGGNPDALSPVPPTGTPHRPALSWWAPPRAPRSTSTTRRRRSTTTSWTSTGQRSG